MYVFIFTNCKIKCAIAGYAIYAETNSPIQCTFCCSTWKPNNVDYVSVCVCARCVFLPSNMNQTSSTACKLSTGNILACHSAHITISFAMHMITLIFRVTFKQRQHLPRTTSTCRSMYGKDYTFYLHLHVNFKSQIYRCNKMLHNAAWYPRHHETLTISIIFGMSCSIRVFDVPLLFCIYRESHHSFDIIVRL